MNDELKPWMLIVMGFIGVLPFLLYLYKFNGGLSPNQEYWGYFGSVLAGSMTGLALMFNFYLVYNTEVRTRRHLNLEKNKSLYEGLDKAIQNLNEVLFKLHHPDVEFDFYDFQNHVGAVHRFYYEPLWSSVNKRLNLINDFYSTTMRDISIGEIDMNDKEKRKMVREHLQGILGKIRESIQGLYY